MAYSDKINNWRAVGFDPFLKRTEKQDPQPPDYIPGSQFDALLDEMLFSRMIRLKDLRTVPQGNDPGKIYWDGANKKYKIWVDATSKWADVVITSTSTSTTSTSSSSSSTSTTSTSTSTTSTSTSTTSTSTSTS
jgi:hypothetical protein